MPMSAGRKSRISMLIRCSWASVFFIVS